MGSQRTKQQKRFFPKHSFPHHIVKEFYDTVRSRENVLLLFDVTKKTTHAAVTIQKRFFRKKTSLKIKTFFQL